MEYDLDKIINIVKASAENILLPSFANIERQYKADGSVVTQVDHDMQHTIMLRLKELYPDVLMLAEEMSYEEQVIIMESGKPFWCLDPLDGTNNFAAGVPYFSVSLALLVNNKVKIGIVYDPMRDELFSATEHGAKLNNIPIELKQSNLLLKQSIGIVDLKRLDSTLAKNLVIEAPFSSLRSFGSVALDWCWLTMNRGHVYLHGRSNIWDYVAGNYIFKMAGGYSAALNGDEVFITKVIKRSSVAAVDKLLFNEWSEWISKHS